MRDEPVAVHQLNDIGGIGVGLIEEQQKDVGRMLRVDGEVDAVRSDGRSERVATPLREGPAGAVLERHSERLPSRRARRIESQEPHGKRGQVRFS